MSTKADAPLTIWLSGASGFVGSAVAAELMRAGHRVVRLVRRATTAHDELEWSPLSGVHGARAALLPCAAVVHLAGENMSGARFSPARKQVLWDSRVGPTEQLSRSLTELTQRPRVFLCASGIGFYGDSGERELTEHSAQGGDFVAQLAGAWEEACAPAREAGIRVVNLRTGLVLHPSGGALKKMVLPFRAGLGGRLGSGAQFVSWISRRDLVRVIEFALFNEHLNGAVNCVSPQPVTNREFTRILASVLNRPALFPVPALFLRCLFGKGLAEMILTSSRARPTRLLDAGFTFVDSDLQQALQEMLKSR